MAKIRAHVFIVGRVQGVCFRMHTQQEALQRDVHGWVRNCDDGRVEAVFEGDEPDVEAMIVWCRSGPPHAAVSGVDVCREPCSGGLDTFRVTS